MSRALRILILAALALTACQQAPAPAPAAAPVFTAATASIAVAPQFKPGGVYQLLAEVEPWALKDIDHLYVALHKLDGQGNESAAIQGVSVPQNQLLAPITFGNLAYDTTYRVRARAYKGAAEDAESLISLPSSYVDIPVGRDDRPDLDELVVNLEDRPFSASADSTGLTVNGGAVVHDGQPQTAGVNRPVEPTDVETVASLPFSASSDMLDVAVDGTGAVFVADWARNVVYKLVGSSLVDHVGGTGTIGAALNGPGGLAIDATGRLFIGERGMITRFAAGSATELAGNRSTPGFFDGPGSDARFNNPFGVAVAKNGDVILADAFNNRIRRLAAGGSVSTIAGQTTAGSGNGRGAAASFNGPAGVAIGPNGDLFVADTNNHKIRRIGPLGDVTTFAGNGSNTMADGKGTAAGFEQPAGLAFDKAGHLWVAERTAVRRIAPDGQVTTIAGVAGVPQTFDGSLAAVRFEQLTGLAIAPNGDVYVVDQNARRLRRLHADPQG